MPRMIQFSKDKNSHLQSQKWEASTLQSEWARKGIIRIDEPSIEMAVHRKSFQEVRVRSLSREFYEPEMWSFC